MADWDNRYSRFVALAKVLLPLAALGLLSTLFLFARQPAGDPTIPFADLEGIAREQRLSEPYFAGVADDGTELSLRAQNARPDAEDPRLFQITAPELQAVSPEGARLTVRAGDGTMDTRERVARLGGLVRVETSNGYSMETTALTANLDTGRIASDSALEIIAPFGRLSAGRMVIEAPRGEETAKMIFKDGVRLLYEPPSEECDPCE